MGTAGTTPAALVFGGYNTTSVANTEDWNGAAWVEVADLNVARDGTSGAGTTTNALAFSGGPAGTSVEEWNSASNTVKTLTD